ncbi:MAG: hypothetical protein Q8M08_09960 [Bacteroidales bacterium]|nr:hypothetical protein [Bacteroidales bacterium]
MTTFGNRVFCKLGYGAAFLMILLFISTGLESYPQGHQSIKNTQTGPSQKKDTISVSRKQKNRIKKSQVFYDSIYHKFARNKFSQALYDMTFVPQGSAGVPVPVHQIKSEILFKKYQGKIIRKIHIYPLDPLGTSMTDTVNRTKSRAARFINNIHLETKRSVIRKNLFFKTGQAIDARSLSENEKLLRQINAFDDANIIVAPIESSADSVDIIVITKDVWSIGIGFGAININKAVIRLYDANFLGFTNLFSTQVSIEQKRTPFFRLDGLSYVFKNIGGFFFDYSIGAFHDDNGNQNFYSLLHREFYSNTTKWAGGTGFNYFRDANIINDSLKIISNYNTGYLWAGRAFLLKNSIQKIRLVILGSAYTQYFSSRPGITPDSNKRYYNVSRLLTGVAISNNRYYLTHYVTEFGKTENVPYGYLLQGTTGPEFNDFYSRLFSGISISAGDFLGNAGYFYGRVSLSGYFYHSSFEDAFLNIRCIWLSTLLMAPNKKYKFRTYLWADYRLGFNYLKNNNDHVSFTSIFDIWKGNDIRNTEGDHSFSASIMTIMFTPWQFYGFKFAIMARFQGGLIAQKREPIFTQPFYSSIKTGFLIKNDNLIFPTMVFSVVYYPNRPPGSPMFFFNVDKSSYLNIPDFNVKPIDAEYHQD